jgi:hypothetical protein
MVVIASPKLLSDQDRELACKQAIEERFNELIETGDVTAVFFEALAAGWEEREVRLGLRALLTARGVSGIDI